ncbi:CopD family protein [Rhodoblastus acidophilus]|uniref:CopD family protein n=1 Tax=Candidatus Rhodoblastus alkanivorans TaxID=2954117 RepID=A0ABS9Z2X9_9HYPH|nr:CopD family protein [Candidatus Rhodoblastus alkanivorans]MCI4677295.1 CopD family protein [Candidatus Rhodoblastus alkanivorans]MCI4682030.1 CopD family protein [Candidatus Rhodoblastus alkanivorans]MDI4643081.1 CopD family protein [Rhodoblastus acidophilus]
MDAAEGLLIPSVLFVTRWLHFSSVFVLFGSAFFWLYAGAGATGARRAGDFVLRLTAPVAVLSGLGWLAGIIANMAGGFDQAVDPAILSLFFTQTQFGPIVEIRLALFAAALGLAALPVGAAPRRLGLILVAAGLLIDQAWLGHAAQGAGLWGVFMIAVYSLHMLSGAAWIGGIASLFLVLRAARGGKASEACAALSSFSVTATFAVVAVVATGLLNAGFHHALDPASWPQTFYGRIVAGKSLLVSAMLVLAVYNRFVAAPKLCAGESAALARLLWSVAVEGALGLGVIAAAALLGMTPPPA